MSDRMEILSCNLIEGSDEYSVTIHNDSVLRMHDYWMRKHAPKAEYRLWALRYAYARSHGLFYIEGGEYIITDEGSEGVADLIDYALDFVRELNELENELASMIED